MPNHSPLNPNAITKRNIARFFSRQRTKEQALFRFGCQRLVEKQVLASERHTRRFDTLFFAMLRRGEIAVREKNRYQTVKGNERDTESREDDAEVEV